MLNLALEQLYCVLVFTGWCTKKTFTEIELVGNTSLGGGTQK